LTKEEAVLNRDRLGEEVQRLHAEVEDMARYCLPGYPKLAEARNRLANLLQEWAQAKITVESIDQAFPACPSCGSTDRITKQGSRPGHFHCERCRQSFTTAEYTEISPWHQPGEPRPPARKELPLNEAASRVAGVMLDRPLMARESE